MEKTPAIICGKVNDAPGTVKHGGSAGDPTCFKRIFSTEHAGKGETNEPNPQISTTQGLIQDTV